MGQNSVANRPPALRLSGDAEAEAGQIQRHYRGFASRAKLLRRELGVQRFYTGEDSQSPALPLLRILLLHRALSEPPVRRTENSISLIEGVIAQVESGLPRERNFFGSKDQEARHKLCAHIAMTSKPADDYLFQQGDLSNNTFYYVLCGAVGVIVNGQHKATLYAGTTFGEKAFDVSQEDIGVRTAGIICISDVLFITLTRGSYLRLTGELTSQVAAAIQVHPHERLDAQLQIALELFNDTTFFKQLSHGSVKEQVCRSCTHVRLRNNELLFRQGDHADSFYIIVTGYVRVVVDGKVIVVLGSGSSFGEAGVIGKTEADRTRTATVLGGSVPGVPGAPMEEDRQKDRKKRKNQDYCDLAIFSRDDYIRVTNGSENRLRTALITPPKDRTKTDLKLLRDLFGGTTFFRMLTSENQMVKCCENVAMVERASGETLFEAGDVGETFYLIVRGSVIGRIPGRHKPFVLEQGDSFGELSVMGSTEEDQRRTATIQCHTDCLFGTLSRAAYLRVTNKLEGEALKVLEKPSGRRNGPDLSVLALYFSDLEFFHLLHFPMMQKAVCKHLTLLGLDGNETCFAQGEDSEGNFFVLLRGRIRVSAFNEEEQAEAEQGRFAALHTFADSSNSLAVDVPDEVDSLRCTHTVTALKPRKDAEKARTVRIEGIPETWTAKDVYECFRVFGPILDVGLEDESSKMGAVFGAAVGGGERVRLNHAGKVATVQFAEPADAMQATREQLVVMLVDNEQLTPKVKSDGTPYQKRLHKHGSPTSLASVGRLRSGSRSSAASSLDPDENYERGLSAILDAKFLDHPLAKDCVLASLTRSLYLQNVYSIIVEVLQILNMPPKDRSVKHLTHLRTFFESTPFFRDTFGSSVMIKRNATRFLRVCPALAGQEVYSQGAVGDRVYIVIRGSVKLESTQSTGEHTNHQLADQYPVHVAGIGVSGWNGSPDSVGRYESDEALRTIFGVYGPVVRTEIRHQISTDGSQNTSWALITMGTQDSVTAIERAGTITVGVDNSVLTVRTDRLDVAEFMDQIRNRDQAEVTAGGCFGDKVIQVDVNKKVHRRETAIATSSCILAYLLKSDYHRACDTARMEAIMEKFFNLGAEQSPTSIEPGITAGDAEPHLDFKGYKQVFLRIGKVIAPKERFKFSELNNSVFGEWQSDLRTFGTPGALDQLEPILKKQEYFDSLFQLIDDWCGGVESVEMYADMLQMILDESTVIDGDGQLNLKPIGAVNCCFQRLLNLRHGYQREIRSTAQDAYDADTANHIDMSAFDIAMASAAMTIHDNPSNRGVHIGSQNSGQEALEEHIREMFNAADKDESGYLDADEVAALATTMMGRELSAEELAAALMEMDPSGDGNVDSDEFRSWFIAKTESDTLLRDLFNSADADGSGILDRDEVAAVLAELGCQLTRAELVKAMAELDTDGSGDVDYDEFSKWWRTKEANQVMGIKRPADEEVYYRQLFDEHDDDGSGELDKDEIRTLMHRLGRDLADHELETAMHLMDEDGSGTVGYEEFSKWFDYLTEQDLSVRRVFEAVDTDDSGYLDRDEMRVAITRLCQQEGHAQLPEEEIQKAMALMDRDGGGQTDYDEFVEWWSIFQFRQNNAPTDPTIQYYRKHFDQMSEDTVHRNFTAGSDEHVQGIKAVLEGNGRVDAVGVLRLCTALGRTLYPHEVTVVFSVFFPKEDVSHRVVVDVAQARCSSTEIVGVRFETFSEWFAKLLHLDSKLLAIFSNMDTGNCGFLRPSQVRTLLDQLMISDVGFSVYEALDHLYPQLHVHGGHSTQKLLHTADLVRWKINWNQHGKKLTQMLQERRVRTDDELDLLQELLESSTLFAVLGAESWVLRRQICQMVSLAQHMRGDIVIAQGEVGSECYVLLQGTAVAITAKEQRSPVGIPKSFDFVEHRQLQETDIFGEGALVSEDAAPHTFSVQCKSEQCMFVTLSQAHLVQATEAVNTFCAQASTEACEVMNTYCRNRWRNQRAAQDAVRLEGDSPRSPQFGAPPRKGEYDYESFRWWWTAKHLVPQDDLTKLANVASQLDGGDNDLASQRLKQWEFDSGIVHAKRAQNQRAEERFQRTRRAPRQRKMRFLKLMAEQEQYGGGAPLIFDPTLSRPTGRIVRPGIPLHSLQDVIEKGSGKGRTNRTLRGTVVEEPSNDKVRSVRNHRPGTAPSSLPNSTSAQDTQSWARWPPRSPSVQTTFGERGDAQPIVALQRRRAQRQAQRMSQLDFPPHLLARPVQSRPVSANELFSQVFDDRGQDDSRGTRRWDKLEQFYAHPDSRPPQRRMLARGGAWGVGRAAQGRVRTISSERWTDRRKGLHTQPVVSRLGLGSGGGLSQTRYTGAPDADATVFERLSHAQSNDLEAVPKWCQKLDGLGSRMEAMHSLSASNIT